MHNFALETKEKITGNRNIYDYRCAFKTEESQMFLIVVGLCDFRQCKLAGLEFNCKYIEHIS